GTAGRGSSLAGSSDCGEDHCVLSSRRQPDGFKPWSQDPFHAGRTGIRQRGYGGPSGAFTRCSAQRPAGGAEDLPAGASNRLDTRFSPHGLLLVAISPDYAARVPAGEFYPRGDLPDVHHLLLLLPQSGAICRLPCPGLLYVCATRRRTVHPHVSVALLPEHRFRYVLRRNPRDRT